MVNMEPCHLKEGVGPYEQANDKVHDSWLGSLHVLMLPPCAIRQLPVAVVMGTSGACLGKSTVGLKSVASPPIHTYRA